MAARPPAAGKTINGTDTTAVFSVTHDPATGVAEVTMRGTAPGNAMGAAVWARLPELIGELEADEQVRAVVLRGAGDCFSVGLDLRWYVIHYRRMLRRGEGHPAFRTQLLDEALRMQEAITVIARSPLPFVAAVTGPCIGAGLDLAAACDVRMAAADAFFSLREIRIGVVADLGSLQRLPRLIGAGATREMALSGRDVPAGEAESLGLVSRVLASPEQLYAHAREFAAEIATRPRHVVAGIKEICEQTQHLSTAEGLRYTAVWNSAFLPAPELLGLLADALHDTPAAATP
jgi:enoyl-CoA hydratase/carnithine racemase